MECPLHERQGYPGPCSGNECSWWIDSKNYCAMVVIAMSLIPAVVAPTAPPAISTTGVPTD